MEKFIRFLEDKVMPAAGKLAAQRHLLAIRNGLMLSLPLIIVGSVFLIFAYLPIPGYEEFMVRTFGELWRTKLTYPTGVTFDLMAIFLSIGVAYHLAKSYEVEALSAGAISLSAFLLVTPYKVMFQPEEIGKVFEVSAIPINLMGSQGMFVAIVIALLSTEIYRFIIKKNIVLKMPDGVPPAVSKSFTALIPAAVVILVTWILRLLIEKTSFESIHTIVTTILEKPLGLIGTTLGGALISVFLIQALWSLGLHGVNITASVLYPIWYALMDQNRIAFEAGESVLPHVTTYQFFFNWVFVGGAGATLALVVLFTFIGKSKQVKSLGRLSIGSSIFNINEPVIFGTPIVLNPILVIPFILVPMVITIISYFAMDLGWVARPCGIAVPWTSPILISGYLATGGKISGVILQIVNFIIAMLLYYPFFKIWDSRKLKEEMELENSGEGGHY